MKSLLIALVLGLAAPVQGAMTMQVAQVGKVGSSCPAPTTKQGNQCVLEGDIVLDRTLEMAADTHLNCKGYKLTPISAGVLDDVTTIANEFVPSQPDLAILIHEAGRVKIQNCNIEGFDFGIFSANAKNPENQGNKILGNTINARTVGVYLLQSDYTVIADNRITYHSMRGRGIAVESNSDRNQITGNTIVSTDSASVGFIRRLPGGLFVPTPNDLGIFDVGIHAIMLSGGGPLANLLINGRLIQIGTGDLPVPLGTDALSLFKTDNNLIERNELVELGGNIGSCSQQTGLACSTNADCPSGTGTCVFRVVASPVAGIQLSFAAKDTLVRENSVQGWTVGIGLAGVSANFTVIGGRQGACTVDPSRLCASDADCTLAGFPNVGTCEGEENVAVNGKSVNNLAEGNTVRGSRLAGMHLGQTVDSTVRLNTIEGPAVRGISLSVDALVSATVERNTVRGSVNGFGLTAGAASPPFQARIRLNDIMGYTNAVLTSNDYALPTELSVDGKGNYWGLPCPGFDPTRVRKENVQINPVVTDSHAFGNPIAMTDPSALPAPCQ